MAAEQKSRLHSGLLLVAAMFWGGSFIMNQITLDAGLRPTFVLMVRFALAAAILGIVFRRDVASLGRKDLAGGLLSGILFCAGFILQMNGLAHTTPSSNAFLTATNIVLVPFFSWIVFRKRPKVTAFAGALLCFLGVCLLSWQPGGAAPSFGMGEALTLLCAVCFASHIVCLGYFAPRINTRGLNFMQILTAAVLTALFYFIADRDHSQFVPNRGHLAILYLVIFSTCIACFIQAAAQKHVSAPQASVIIATESLFAAVFSVAAGFERLRASLIAGGLLILVSVCIVEADFSVLWRKKRETQIGVS